MNMSKDKEEIRKMLKAAGVPNAYLTPKSWDELGQGAVIISKWLKNNNAATMQGRVVLLEIPAVAANTVVEDIRWTFNLIHIYMVLLRIPTARFDAWEIKDSLNSSAWEALEEATVIFIEGVCSRGDGFSPQQRRTIEYFLKTALERNINVVFLHDLAKSGNQWEGFSQAFEALVRSRTVLAV